MRLLGEEISLRDNLRFSLRRYRVWWAILLVTIVFDYLTTIGFIAESGLRAEANPLIRWLIANLGLFTGLAVGKCLQLVPVAVFAALNRRMGNVFLLVVIALNCWAVVVNSL